MVRVVYVLLALGLFVMPVSAQNPTPILAGDPCNTGTGNLTGNYPDCIAPGGGGGSVPRKQYELDFSACPRGTAEANWDVETGTAIPVCESPGPLVLGTLQVDSGAATTVCMQRMFTFGATANLAQPVEARIEWVADSTSGNLTLTLALKCIAEGSNPATGPFNAASTVTAGIDGAELYNHSRFLDAQGQALSTAGCSAGATAFLRACKTAQTLSGGTNNTVRLYRLLLWHSYQ